MGPDGENGRQLFITVYVHLDWNETITFTLFRPTPGTRAQPLYKTMGNIVTLQNKWPRAGDHGPLY